MLHYVDLTKILAKSYNKERDSFPLWIKKP